MIKNILLSYLCIWYLKSQFLVKIPLNRLTPSEVRRKMCFCLAGVIVIGTRDELSIFNVFKQSFSIYLEIEGFFFSSQSLVSLFLLLI